MNYCKDKKSMNNINDYINQKIIISNKNYYCTNCNKRGHTYKKCYEPIISNGIISFYIKDFDYLLIPELENYITVNINNKKLFEYNKNFNKYSNNIKFLMVQRAHSLGYMEFMRGRYSIENDKEITFLLEQMTPFELSELANRDFDYLWNMLWDFDSNSKNTIKNKYHQKEYITSKHKFYKIKMTNPQKFLSTTPKYNFNEWGFPKGRREMYESDIVCAMREFEEETSYKETEYYILDETNIVKENLIGTNGIYYKHNYFLALLQNEPNEPSTEYNEKNKKQKNKEIGDIKFMCLDECIKKIRPYHTAKQQIIKKIHNLIINFLIIKNEKTSISTNLINL